jgi:hypothetical protein
MRLLPVLRQRLRQAGCDAQLSNSGAPSKESLSHAGTTRIRNLRLMIVMIFTSKKFTGIEYVMRTTAIVISIVALCGCSGSSPRYPDAGLAAYKRPLEPANPLVGMTYDRIAGDYVAPVKELGVKPAIRIAFNPGTSPSYYARGIARLSPIAYLMAEPVDSSEVKATSLHAYVSKFKTFLRAFPNIQIWEVGNELNGEWLGGKPYTKAVGLQNPVVAKAYYAWQAVSSASVPTALTLYYQPPQTVTHGYEMLPWARANFASLRDMAQSLSYVLVSYYEVDNDEIRPSPAQWSRLFSKLHAIFPNAQLGFGEVGLDCPFDARGKHCGSPTLAKAKSVMRYYYTLKPSLPAGAHWAAGDFWWYAAEDFEPTNKPLYAYFKSLVSP